MYPRARAGSSLALPRARRAFPQGKFVKSQLISVLFVFQNKYNVLKIYEITNFPWGKLVVMQFKS